MNHKHNKGGFTIVEIVIIIVVVSILALLVINLIPGASEKARVAKAESELQTIDNAILAMGVDVQKWPNGCIIGLQLDPEVEIEVPRAGLTQEPPVGTISTGCEWTAADVENWQGPYLADQTLFDPWGNSYMFDPDYHPWSQCASKTDLPLNSVIVSYGEDGQQYTCDDVFRIIGD